MCIALWITPAHVTCLKYSLFSNHRLTKRLKSRPYFTLQTFFTACSRFSLKWNNRSLDEYELNARQNVEKPLIRIPYHIHRFRAVFRTMCYYCLTLPNHRNTQPSLSVFWLLEGELLWWYVQSCWGYFSFWTNRRLDATPSATGVRLPLTAENSIKTIGWFCLFLLIILISFCNYSYNNGQ